MCGRAGGSSDVSVIFGLLLTVTGSDNRGNILPKLYPRSITRLGEGPFQRLGERARRSYICYQVKYSIQIKYAKINQQFTLRNPSPSFKCE